MAEYVTKEQVQKATMDAIAKYIPTLIGWRERIPLEIANAIESVSTEDVAPVIHAKWEIDDFTGLIKCGNCKDDAYLDTTSGEQCRSSYCPTCGARMDGE